MIELRMRMEYDRIDLRHAGAAGQRENRVAKIWPFSSVNAADWIRYRRRFLEVKTVNRWTDETAKSQLVISFEGGAADATGHLQGIEDETFNEYLLRCDNAFLSTSDMVAAKHAFQTTIQAAKESGLLWHNRIRGLFIRGYPNEDPETSTFLINRYVMGTRHAYVREKLAEGDPLTLRDALAIVSRGESVLSVRAATALIHGVHSLSEPTGGEANAMSRKGRRPMGNGCWNCGIEGHIRIDCKKAIVKKDEGGRYSNKRKATGKAPLGATQKKVNTVDAKTDADRTLAQLGN